MKKFILSLTLLCGCVLGSQAQLLYKVSKDSSDVKPSYIVASNRLINPMGTITQVSELRDAMTYTDQMYFEVNKAAYANSLKDAKKLENGKTLLSLLTPAQQTKLNAFLKKYMEVDFRSSYVQKKYGNLTPAALMEDLEQLLFVANHMGQYDPTHTFDQYFEAQAKANNETVGGLSDVDAYINATYKSDLKQQVARLVEFLENEPTELAKLNKAVGAFKAQDVDAAAKATGAHVSQATLEAWAAKVQTVMAEKPTFFVVDAANLGGENGLLQLLRNAGCKVEK
uniref:TraB/GumN family protein n=1 Tax=Prevotella sp. TaxID=59823 RepID=UPI004028DE53